MKDDSLHYFVGSELRLSDMLPAAEAKTLLGSITGFLGVPYAAIVDGSGKVLHEEGRKNPEYAAVISEAVKKGAAAGKGFSVSPLRHEGETVGFLYVFVYCGGFFGGRMLSGLADLSSKCLHMLMQNNAKRMLAAQLHTNVVNQSYEELLETNRRLAASEDKYKRLSETLEQEVAERTGELKRAYSRLLEQGKMASIGQLAAGIAHEINNPMGFISSNLNTFGKYMESVERFIGLCRSGARPAEAEEEETCRRLTIDFILADIRDLLRDCMDGAERIKKIVSDLKGFSHIDEAVRREMDLNAEMENTLNVLSHEIKSKSARIERDFFYGGLKFRGNPGRICQAFLNLLMNAIQSRQTGLVIAVKTWREAGNLCVSVSDNGEGIPEEIQGRIFEPFFTTKNVGKGMGMGLAVAYEIVEAYRGAIEVKSRPGEGAKFTIRLPAGTNGDAKVEDAKIR